MAHKKMDHKKILIIENRSDPPTWSVGVAEALLRGMCAPSRAEEGCTFYNLFTPIDGSGSFHFIECWRDQAALDAHREMPHYKDFREKLGDLMDGPPKAHLLRTVDFAFPKEG